MFPKRKWKFESLTTLLTCRLERCRCRIESIGIAAATTLTSNPALIISSRWPQEDFIKRNSFVYQVIASEDWNGMREDFKMASDVITFRVDYAPRVSIRYLYFTLFYFHEKFSLRQFKRPPKVIERKIRVPKARPNLGRRNRCVEIIFQHIIKTLTFTRKLAIIFANHWINGKLKLIRERETFPGRGEAARQSQPSLEKMGKSGTKRTRSFSPL